MYSGVAMRAVEGGATMATRSTVALEDGPDLEALLARVERGEALALTRGGAAVARLAPVRDAPPRAKTEALIARLKRGRAGRIWGDRSIEDVLSDDRDGW